MRRSTYLAVPVVCCCVLAGVEIFLKIDENRVNTKVTIDIGRPPQTWQTFSTTRA